MNPNNDNALLHTVSPKYPYYSPLITSAVIGFFVAGLAIALLTPEDILDYRIADNFVEAMKFIPYVENSQRYSPLPDVASFFAAVMWVLAIVVVSVSFLPLVRTKYQVDSDQLKLKQGIKYVLALLIVVFLAATAIDVSHTTKLGRLALSSRLGIGVFGTLRIFMIPFSLVGLIFYVRNWRFWFYGDLELLKK